MIFGRTELIISASKAKFDEEADGEVHWQPNPQNPDEKRKNYFFGPIFFAESFFSASKNKMLKLSETRFPEFRAQRT